MSESSPASDSAEWSCALLWLTTQILARAYAARLLLVVGVMLLAAAQALAEAATNGFSLTPASIPAGEILAGGPPRDGIPALVDPKRIAAERAPWSSEEWVVGVAIGEAAAAYPIAILEWHELSCSPSLAHFV